MKSVLFSVLFLFLQYTAASIQQPLQICGNDTIRQRSCAKIIGKQYMDYDSCKVEYYPPNSLKCIEMNFGPIATNSKIGGVTLQPHILHSGQYSYAVINITFTNIRWKTMQFRFNSGGSSTADNHCRKIVISNNEQIDDRSVMYYDCYHHLTDNKNEVRNTHYLDFEATDGSVVNTGKYYFKIPSIEMLSKEVTEVAWRPFVYIELMLLQGITTAMKLHIDAPPSHLNITSYKIEVKKDCSKCANGTWFEEIVKTVDIQIKNISEVTYEFTKFHGTGLYYFIVTPQHESCLSGAVQCQRVESPKLKISNDIQENLHICIASITALVVATLFAFYIILRMVRKFCCSPYLPASGSDIAPPPKVLAVYPSANLMHKECVSSFIAYLRSEYGLDIEFDGDIANMPQRDPEAWANDAFRRASNIMYIVGPPEEANAYNNIYDKPIINATKDIDLLVLSMIRKTRSTKEQKEVCVVYFEHSLSTPPIELSHDKAYRLLKDWQKLISYLSKNMLPEKQIKRSTKGVAFLDDLKRAKKTLSLKSDEMIIKCETMNLVDNKV